MGLHFQILMEARNLERYGMFKWVGALPMHRESASTAYLDLGRAAGVLRRPATSLWVFPQGSRRPPQESITGTERGAAHLALGIERPATLWPVGFRYAYRGEQIPEAFVWLGQPLSLIPGDALAATRRERRRECAAEIEHRLQHAVAELDRRLAVEEFGEFKVLVPGRRSINKRMDRVRHALGSLTGPFEERNG